MMPAEMIYAAMKVYEWTEGVARKEMREYELGQEQKKKRKPWHEAKLQREATNEAMQSMTNRQVRVSTEA